ncbi:hypothetical protein [Psychrobacter urativorans]|uniref:Uncharacterized protein n=1 Tax=Psychrobacter urativorans TaxID=45610 RepID=A0A0M4SYH2_9GAMM|nr:hypothetical protein [Psychrobacter urativorans]ALF60122.1 hypothetical protein AOC03_08790 [Psychrobacter urativorans]
MGNNPIKDNLKPHHMADNGKQAGKRGLLPSFIIFMAWVVAIGLLIGLFTSLVACQPVTAKQIASDNTSGYHSVTATRSGAKPSPQSLAIFVSKTDLINTQQVTTDMNNSVTSSNRYTYDTGHSAVRYDGLSEPNKIPFLGNKFRRLNAIVNDPFYPFFMLDLKHTNRSGGHHHA